MFFAQMGLGEATATNGILILKKMLVTFGTHQDHELAWLVCVLGSGTRSMSVFNLDNLKCRNICTLCTVVIDKRLHPLLLVSKTQSKV